MGEFIMNIGSVLGMLALLGVGGAGVWYANKKGLFDSNNSFMRDFAERYKQDKARGIEVDIDLPRGNKSNPTALSKSGIEALTKYEGLRLKVYKDQAGYETIGYGHKLGLLEKNGTLFIRGSWVDYRNGITAAQAMTLFKQDVSKFESAVSRLVTVPINQNQFDALVSLVYNIGEGAFTNSTALKRLNAGDYQGVGEAIKMWNKVTIKGRKVVSNGLVNRRAQEVARFYA